MSEGLRKAIVEHIVISYARPFTKCQLEPKPKRREVLLDGSIVPPELRKTHDHVLEMRDCAVGHKDSTAFHGSILNRVRIEVRAGDIAVQTTSIGNIEPDVCDKIIVLCQHLIDYCAKSMDPVMRDNLVGTKCPPDGIYCLNMDPASKEWLKQIG
jgi:hypothetical protein